MLKSLNTRTILLGLLLALTALGCSRVYYATMEKLGKEKRDILVGRVEDVRDEQQKAKEQFQTALEAYQAVTGFSGGELEKVYKKLDKEYERSADRAKDVSDRIESIEKVAADLFKEWRKEIDQISDSSLKNRSRRLLSDTEQRYEALAGKLKQTESKMAPVLQTFQDHVLFLKHNLNAQAIDSLRETAVEVDVDVAALIKDIDDSIREAEEFIAAMG